MTVAYLGSDTLTGFRTPLCRTQLHGKAQATQMSRGFELLEAAEAAYLIARSEVYDHGLHEGDVGLTPHQQTYLDSLKAAEDALKAYRREKAQPQTPRVERKP